MTENTTPYQTTPPERLASPEPEISMQLQIARLIERHGWSTILEHLVLEADIFSGSKLAVALEKVRDVCQGHDDE